MARQMYAGSVTGTGSAINVALGWIPDYVKLVNHEDVAGLEPIIEWTKTMGDGHGVKYLSIADDGTTTNVSHEAITTGGVSGYPGDATQPRGFTIGADVDLNVDGETIHVLAMRNG